MEVTPAVIDRNDTLPPPTDAQVAREPLHRVMDRILTLQQRREFEPFVTWLSRRAPKLLSRFHWRVYGAQLNLGREAEQPTRQDLQRLFHLIREECPVFLTSLREVVRQSPLATETVKQGETSASIQPPSLRRKPSLNCLAVAP